MTVLSVFSGAGGVVHTICMIKKLIELGNIVKADRMGVTCTVRELFEECLDALDDSMDNEQVIGILRAYGEKLRKYRSKYSEGRASTDGSYSSKVAPNSSPSNLLFSSSSRV